MDCKEIELSIKEYSLLERSLRGVSLSHKLCSNQPISKNDLVMELLEEIRDIEYDEGGDTPLESRVYESGRNLLKTITEKIYPDDANKYVEYLSGDELVNLKLVEQDIMITFKIA